MTLPVMFPLESQLAETDTLVVFFENKILVQSETFLWTAAAVATLSASTNSIIYIDTLLNKRYYLMRVSQNPLDKIEGELRSLRSLLFSNDELAFSIAGKAAQLEDWYKTHRYCGSCGAPNEDHIAQRAVCCTACQNHYFPRINPCAIMLVVNGDKILLARSSRFKSNFFSCLAGFIEVGETAEETVCREVKEEVGIDVENIRYLKSQSWPFPSQLMLAFIADYKSGAIVPDLEEIAEANWYHVNDLPAVPSAAISVAGELIQHYVNQVNGVG
ncbi:MAG: NAD+ diphosphatase [Pseudohongiellaceae bacterium]|jgi:NAD+ diphosphatase